MTKGLKVIATKPDDLNLMEKWDKQFPQLVLWYSYVHETASAYVCICVVFCYLFSYTTVNVVSCKKSDPNARFPNPSIWLTNGGV